MGVSQHTVSVLNTVLIPLNTTPKLTRCNLTVYTRQTIKEHRERKKYLVKLIGRSVLYFAPNKSDGGTSLHQIEENLYTQFIQEGHILKCVDQRISMYWTFPPTPTISVKFCLVQVFTVCQIYYTTDIFCLYYTLQASVQEIFVLHCNWIVYVFQFCSSLLNATEEQLALM
jgi:hypothetical protein